MERKKLLAALVLLAVLFLVKSCMTSRDSERSSRPPVSETQTASEGHGGREKTASEGLGEMQREPEETETGTREDGKPEPEENKQDNGQDNTPGTEEKEAGYPEEGTAGDAGRAGQDLTPEEPEKEADAKLPSITGIPEEVFPEWFGMEKETFAGKLKEWAEKNGYVGITEAVFSDQAQLHLLEGKCSLTCEIRRECVTGIADGNPNENQIVVEVYREKKEVYFHR